MAIFGFGRVGTTGETTESQRIEIERAGNSVTCHTNGRSPARRVSLPPQSMIPMMLMLGLASVSACAQSIGVIDTLPAPLEATRQELAEQGVRLEALRRELAEQQARVKALAIEVDQLQGRRAPRAAEGAMSNAQGDAIALVPVGIAPSNPSPEPNVAPIFEQPGVLTAKGHYVLEPSLQYGYSSSNSLSLVGYTVIPALLVGLINVREVKNNTTTATLAGRMGLTNRLEIEAKIPYVYRSNSTVSRETFTGTSTDSVFNTSGDALGDIELAARYQLNDGGVDNPYFIGTLRFKSRTGKDPFQVVTDCVTSCAGNTTGTGLPLDEPTGSGFYSLQPGLTWLFPSDPAVFFGSFSYTYNFKRDDVSLKILNGEHQFIGSVQAGDVIGMNFGIGLAMNDRSSFSVGVDLNTVGRTKENGVTIPGSVRTQLATLLFGYSYRLSDRTTLSVAVGAGLTRDTPDLTLNIKLPMSF